METHNHDTCFDEGYIHVSEIHKVYYAQYGKADGKPVIFLHGGPGGGTSKSNTEFFDPAVYRVVLLDQRGAGRSRPVAELRENTTQHLIADIETLRKKLSITQWHIVFGGSWGSTLSLAYSQAHPEACGALVIRGVFLCMDWEFQWTLQGGGASVMFPDKWEEFVNFLPKDKRSKPVQAYNEMLFGGDRETMLRAATSWNRWEMSISFLVQAEDAFDKLEDNDWVLQHARIEAHYFANGGFLRDGKEILNPANIDRIKQIPVYIVQGRYDVVCPPKAAWSLHKLLPKSELHWSPDAGHSALEPGTKALLTKICDQLR